MNQVKTVILQQCQQVGLHKQADKMNHGAHVGCCSQNKSIIIYQINQKSYQYIEIATIWRILAHKPWL